MKNKLPRPRELMLFAALALVATVIVGLVGKHDVAIAFAGGPLFLVGAIMGLNRSGDLKGQPKQDASAATGEAASS
jgi:hypothetical protein